ncbi:selenocysteine lyase [Nitzschia inconspicua]|uniref:Selenocysteine lyase n=1 Tax=Nitzschia inconspicua TaxID=303405 RepID=A0A9K3LVN3_9STRA|nr:selenocysteine lyase [Nitzschia inconspicua]
MPTSPSANNQNTTLLLTALGGSAVFAAAAWVSLKRSKTVSSNLPSSKKKTYYLDYNGTTPIYPQVLEAMMPYLQHHFGNPSSGHVYGQEPRRAIDEARSKILHHLLGAPTTRLDAIWFTGCGTEADNLAIYLAVQTVKEMDDSHKKKPHIVTSNVEHPAIELYLKSLEQNNSIDVTYVPVDTEGRVSAEEMIAALRENTVLVTLMLANNESGALQPVAEVSRVCRQRGILFHTDAAQAAGKVSCHIHAIGDPDMISIVGHKIGAPKGIAALYVRPGCLEEQQTVQHKNKPNHGLLIGGGQEFGMRGGTENTPYIVALGRAAELAQTHLKRNAAHMEEMRARLLKNLQYSLGASNVLANGPQDHTKRLPNTLSVGIDSIHSGQLLADVGDTVAASAGATCHSTASISSVLRAMKVPESYARGTLRLSVGPSTTTTDVDEAADIIANAVRSQWEVNQRT